MRDGRFLSKLAIIVCVLAFSAVLVTIILLDSIFKGDNFVNDTAHGVKDRLSTIEIDGVKYKFNNNVNYLIIGLDRFGKANGSDYGVNPAQADFLAILSVNKDTKKYFVLPINRDTITDVWRLSLAGQRVMKLREQIALSHSYGNGLDQSCKNTVDAVTELLYGLPIDYYCSMTMDVVKAITDYIGGVTVTLDENQDLSKVHSDWLPNATIKLTGQTSLDFVRSRKDVEDESNISRMHRQEQYLQGFFEVISKTDVDTEFVSGAYEKVADYIVTDCTSLDFINVFDCFEGYDFEGFKKIEGESGLDNGGYKTFIVDEDALKELVINTYLVKK